METTRVNTAAFPTLLPRSYKSTDVQASKQGSKSGCPIPYSLPRHFPINLQACSKTDVLASEQGSRTGYPVPYGLPRHFSINLPASSKTDVLAQNKVQEQNSRSLQPAPSLSYQSSSVLRISIYPRFLHTIRSPERHVSEAQKAS